MRIPRAVNTQVCISQTNSSNKTPTQPNRSALDTSLKTRQQDGAATTATSVTAAACLPWQGARVCIVALAPSLTFAGAVGLVEDEARRASNTTGVVLCGQSRLLIGTDRY